MISLLWTWWICGSSFSLGLPLPRNDFWLRRRILSRIRRQDSIFLQFYWRESLYSLFFIISTLKIQTFSWFPPLFALFLTSNSRYKHFHSLLPSLSLAPFMRKTPFYPISLFFKGLFMSFLCGFIIPDRPLLKSKSPADREGVDSRPSAGLFV